MNRRRKLVFASLDEVIPDVERLLAGHATVGRWSLGQICNHLATVFNLLVDGVPGLAPPGLLKRCGSWFFRKGFFAVGRFPSGVKTPRRVLVPREGLDCREQADALRAALARFVAATGPFPAHPFLGAMTKDEWVRFHLMHMAHHLSFAVPQQPSSL